MKRNFEKVICDIDGVQIPSHLIKAKNEGEEDTIVYLTYKKVCSNLLLGNYQGDSPSGSEKLERFELAKKISTSDESTEFTAKELHTIEELSSKYSTTLIHGQLKDFIDSE